jgi:phosphatidylglycerophosphate synthase
VPFGQALAELPRLKQNSLSASMYCVVVNRPVGRVLAALASSVGATPNGVSVLSGLFSLLGLALLVTLPASIPLGFAVAACLVFAFMLDSADGQLARLQRSSSSVGEWLDHVIDCATKLLLHMAVLIALFRSGEEGAVLLIPIAFQFVSVLQFFAGILIGKLREQGVAQMPGAGSKRRSLALCAVDHGVLCSVFVLWGWPTAFLAVYTVFFVIAAVYLVVVAAKWLRELAAA